MSGATRATSPVLRPYNGSHHCLPGGCPKVLPTFTSDMSGRVLYIFNSLGFRGDEFESTLLEAGGPTTFGE
jgi:hypothetical protein